MNIQEAYKKLDLAKGLNKERVEDKYLELKSEIESKISSTHNERLKQVYTNRLTEVEEAYNCLVDYFNNNGGKNSNLSNSEESKPIIEDVSGAPKVQPIRKKTFIFLSVFAVLIAIGGFLYFNSDVFVSEEVDLFRKMEGEQQVFVNNLTLRQYPDAKSSKIEVFPIGTRLFFEENELPKTDDKQRVWRKVRVIHPVYGWERPDERFPYPYEGWMAIEECGVPWVEDSLTTANLLRILGNEDAGRSITSSYRHGLVEFFQQNSYFGEWIVYGSDKKDKMQNVMLTNLGNSDDDCKGDDQLDFVALMNSQNSRDQKLIVMSTDRDGNSRVVYESTIDPTREEAIEGMRNLTSAELRAFNRKYNTYAGKGILLNMGKYDQKVLFIENGSVNIYYF
jgi:hypothetical protein